MNFARVGLGPNLARQVRIRQNRIRERRRKRQVPMRQAVARPAAALPAQRLATRRRLECRRSECHHRVASLIFRHSVQQFPAAMARRTDGSRFHPHQHGASASVHPLAIERGSRSRLRARRERPATPARFPDTTRLLDAAVARAPQ